jgi:hypothetical protein
MRGAGDGARPRWEMSRMVYSFPIDICGVSGLLFVMGATAAVLGAGWALFGLCYWLDSRS